MCDSVILTSRLQNGSQHLGRARPFNYFSPSGIRLSANCSNKQVRLRLALLDLGDLPLLSVVGLGGV